MSMNIHFVATRDIVVKATGKCSTQELSIDVWQTPTDVTYKIARSDNPVQAYVDWVLANFDRDEQLAVYAEDDIFCNGAVVGYSTYNDGKEHAERFLEEVEALKQDGWKITAEIM